MRSLAPDDAAWAVAGVLIGLALYAMRVRGWRRVFVAGGIAFVSAFLMPDRKKSITPPSVAAVPDAGLPDLGPSPPQGMRPTRPPVMLVQAPPESEDEE